MKRRDFIKKAGMVSVAVPLSIQGMKLNAFASSPLLAASAVPPGERIIVLVQLLGGNDGLHTVVPLDQYANLANARPNIILPQGSIIQVTPTVGFHPVLTGLKNIYDNGQLGIIQNVGYPNQNRSHFRSQDIWWTGSDATQHLTTGWAGRAFDTEHPGYPSNYPNTTYPDPIAIALGNPASGAMVAETCQGILANYSMAMTDPTTLQQVYAGGGTTPPLTNYGDELTFIRGEIASSNAYATGVLNAYNAGTNTGTYPNTNMAQQLKRVAKLISGGLQTRMYVVTQPNYDTHANQVVSGNTTTGAHANLLQEISDAINSFQTDLVNQSLEDKVVGVTLSEFGRQIKSNYSNGTDHGTAAPLFVFGSCVKPQIMGNNPTISASVQDQEGVPMQYDFRDVYGSLLEDWFGIPEATIKNIFSPSYTKLDIISAPCKAPVGIENISADNLALNIYPVPSTDYSTIQFTTYSDEHISLALYDALGSQLEVLMNKKIAPGEHQIKLDLTSYAKGNYCVRIQSSTGIAKTKMIVKM